MPTGLFGLVLLLIATYLHCTLSVLWVYLTLNCDVVVKCTLFFVVYLTKNSILFENAWKPYCSLHGRFTVEIYTNVKE